MIGTPEQSQGERVAYTPREAAAMLGISERMLWGMSKRGEIRSVKVGRLVRYYRPDLVAFMERGSNGEREH